MFRFNKILLFLNVAFIAVIITVGIVNAWTNPSGAPPAGGGALYYSGGNVGIGTASPISLLTVGTGTNTYPATPAGSYGAITLNGGSLVRFVMDDGTGNFTQYLNAYYDSASAAHKYAVTAPANRFVMSSGQYTFYVATSGTVGNTITWKTALSIDINGTSTVGGNLIVSGNSNTCTKVAYTYPGTVSCPQYYYVSTIGTPTQSGTIICCKVDNP